MTTGRVDEEENSSSGSGGLPTLGHLRLRPAGATAAPSATPATWLPAAWSGAFDDPGLMSPVASGACGRLVTDTSKTLPALEELHAEETQAGAKWPARAREAKNLFRLALPMSVTNFLGFAIGLVTIRWVPACCKTLCRQ